MLSLIAAALLAQGADAVVDLDPLHRFATKAVHIDMVAVMPEHDKPGWCKGRRVAKLPVRALTGPFKTQLGGAVAAATAGRQVRLRERACADTVFRIIVTEWRFGDEAAAKAAEEKIAKANHNAEALKSVHRLWRVRDRLYFAESGAFQFWERFGGAMTKLGAPSGSCSHQ